MDFKRATTYKYHGCNYSNVIQPMNDLMCNCWNYQLKQKEEAQMYKVKVFRYKKTTALLSTQMAIVECNKNNWEIISTIWDSKEKELTVIYKE